MAKRAKRGKAGGGNGGVDSSGGSRTSEAHGEGREESAAGALGGVEVAAAPGSTSSTAPVSGAGDGDEEMEIQVSREPVAGGAVAAPGEPSSAPAPVTGAAPTASVEPLAEGSGRTLVPNAEVIDGLFARLRAGECIVVVGAGLLETVGAPGWRALVTRLAGKLGAASADAPAGHDVAAEIARLIERGRALLALSSIERRLGRDVVREEIRGAFAPADAEETAPSEILRALAALPFRAAVTTAPAGPLGRVIADAIGRPLREATHDELAGGGAAEAAFDAKQRFLLWAFGRCARPGSVLLTARDLRRALAGERAFRDLLEEIYRDRTLLLVGFRPDDPDLELLLTRLFPALPPTEREHYLAIAGQTLVETEDLFYEHRIRTVDIAGDAGGERDGKGGQAHAGLLTLLRDLRARCEREGVPLAAEAARRPARDDVEGWVAELLNDPRDDEAVAAVERLARELREQGSWERLVELLLGKVEAQGDPEARISVLREVARVFEDELRDPARALTAVVGALAEAPLAEDLIGEAERLAAASSGWSDLVAAYAELAPNVPEESKGAYFARLGRWYLDKLAHADYALASFEAAREAEPTRRDALEGLAALHRKAERWGELADVMEAQAAALGDEAPAEKVDLLLALGDVAETNLHSTERAATAYRKALDIEPKNADALASFEALLRRQEQWGELVSVLRRRAEAELDAATQGALRREIGRLLEEQKDAAGSVEAYEAAVAIEPRDAAALRALEHLYDDLGKTEEYLRTLERLSDCAEDDKGRVALFRRMAIEWEERPSGAGRAVEWWERLLALDPRSEEAYRALARLHRREQRWEPLCEALARHAAVAEGGAARADLHAQAAEVFEKEQEDPHRAIEAWLAVEKHDPQRADVLPSLARLYERIEAFERAIEVRLRLGEKLAQAADKAAAVEQVFRAAELSRDKVADAAAAEARFVDALALDPAHFPSMLALIDLYGKRGEYLRAANLRVEAEAATSNRLEKVRLLHEAAVAYQDLLDQADKAAELYDRALALDPEHVEAGERLAELRLRAERFADAVPVLEMLVRKCDTADRPRLARLARDLGRAAEQAKDDDKALRAYRQATEAAPEDVTPVAALAALAFRRGDDGEAESQYRRLVGDFRPALPEGAIVEAHHRLGVLARKRGDVDAARTAFDAARAVDPAHKATLLALAELAHESGEFRTVIDSRRALLETASGDERARLLEEIGDLYRDKLGDKTAAIGAYLEALEVHSDSPRLLHSLLELYSEERQWRRAVDIVKRLADTTKEPAHRAKYFYAAAVICRDEIGADAQEEALELMSRALEEDPSFLKAFDAMERLLAAREDYRGLARAYRKAIKRLPPRGEDELRLRLWTALAGLCLEKLGERDAGIAALEVVNALAPDTARQDLLTRLYIESGPTYAEKAIAGQQQLLRREPDRLAGYRTLRRLYVETGQRDKAWCLAGALRFLNAADSTDVAEWEAGRPTGFVAAKRRLTEELWQKHVIHWREDRVLGALFTALTPVVAPLTAQPLQALGLKRGAAIDAVKDERMVSKLFRYATHTLGVTPPDLFLRPESKDPLQVANVGEKGTVQPALLVGAPHLDKKNEKELLFDLVKRLAFLRPERYLRFALPQAGAVAGAVAAALAATGVAWPDGPPVEVDKGDVEKLAAHLRRTLAPAALDQVGALARKLVTQSDRAPIDPKSWLKGWMDAVDLTASRAAFILTDDFEIAARLVASETGGGSSLSAKERLKELLAYSVSEDYFVVRKHLGLDVSAGA